MDKKTILLRLSNNGEPINNNSVHNGVLILPSVPLPEDYKPGDIIFNLTLVLNAASKVSRNGIVYLNVPNHSEKFDRLGFKEYPIISSFDKDIVIKIPIYKSGTYCYYIKYQDSESKTVKTEEFYFNVPPNLRIKNNFVPFNAINIQSLVSKWCGPLENWDSIFKEISDKGYNMIHFTPLQQRGESNSPYSIFDQLTFDTTIFKDNQFAIDFLTKSLDKYNLMSLTDVVWNHTANNSDWIKQHPDSGYNQDTAPNLKSAIELDSELLRFSQKLEDYKLPSEINNIDQLNQIMEGIDLHVLTPLNLWQYYIFNKDEILSSLDNEFNKNLKDIKPIDIPSSIDSSNLKELAKFVLETCNINQTVILEDRYSNNLDSIKFLGILSSLFDNDLTSIEFSALNDKASTIIDEINLNLYKTYDDDLGVIKNQLSDRIRYLRLDENGPKLGKITNKSPLTESYFTRFQNNGKDYALANNGWIWGGNPLVDFASSESKAYLRREVIIWADCIKLRYGNGPEDSPYLWERMIKYTEICAKTFNGFRIDNCHSTPLHVGEKLLDAARNINPDLYVVAELFSGSEAMDKIFVERLGINSLIREAMQAWNVAELSRLVHKHGGRPIGSYTWLPLDEYAYPASKELGSDSQGLGIPKVLTNQAPHALFMDCTHDNETPNQKRTVEDTLPNAALVAFCSSAIGSVFGYDECYPNLLDVVGETRHYSFDKNNGIGEVKAKLHKIRKSLAEESEDILRDHEMYIHHEGEYITIQRYNARTAKGWFLIARTKFNSNDSNQVLSPCILNGTKVRKEFAYSLIKTGEYESDDKKLTSIPTSLKELHMPDIEFINNESIITVGDNFVPGSIAVYSTEIPGVDINLDNYCKLDAIEESIDLDLYDLNALLYRCEAEERDYSNGAEGTYNLPGYGNLVYAGFEGWNSVLKSVIWENKLAHPISNHLREGTWALDYIINRLNKYSTPGLDRFKNWLVTRIEKIKNVPYFLRPHFFALVVGIAYQACRFRSLRLLSSKIQNSTNFIQSLALTSIQMSGKMNNTSLLPDKQIGCLAAGLPHFSNDYMRCWGRDVFISFRGLLIVPERYDDAKNHILGFAKTLKHGLIPNLLDAGRNPRYNARDAVWFFLQAIQEYIEYVPDGIKILDEKVSRRFPLNDDYIPYDDPQAFSYESSIREIIYEVFSRHAQGIKYREANAGSQLDSQMKSEGFNVEVNVDWSNGLIFGGQQFNCGTWMDKMGESERAGNKGYPGTPRDGAAIEIQGLLKSSLRFINKLGKDFGYTEVSKSDGSTITFKDWEQLIEDNFEKCFYIPLDPKQDKDYNLDSKLINRRGIYKDLYLSGKPYEDYQLRPNFAIAMSVSPELFDIEKGYQAVKIADKIIRGPIGMRTLDPSDWNYRPYYLNSVDNDDFATAKGRNYHQGPEWCWCIGYFLRAYVRFSCLNKSLDNQDTTPTIEILTDLNEKIQYHIKWIKESPWAGLTELTNKDGDLCHDSSPTQAWSSSCLLDLYFDLWKLSN